jgi:peptidyl-prolyl cis-trans isomerase C
MDGFAEVLNEVISQRILSMAAEEQALDVSEEAQRRIALARERELGNLLVERHLEATVSEGALRELYEKQLELREPAPQVRGRHILVESEAEAEAVRERLEAGESFADVATDVSLDEATSGEGGALNWFTRESFETAFTDAAFATRVGAVSSPVETAFGWHVILVEERRADSPPPYEDLREELSVFLTYDSIQALMLRLREAAEVEILVESSGE